ncbi:hypothetical protein [Pilimelia terevasa]|nr:hypothetical protein [Pilimelia terevasa]
MRTALLAAPALLLAGCTTASAPAPTTPRAEASQAPAPTPTADTVHALGASVDADDITVTAYAYKALPAAGATQHGVIDAKACNRVAEDRTVSQGPWLLSFADDTEAEAGGTGVLRPEYPFDGRKLRPGQCVRGWVPVELPKSARRPVMVVYRPSLPGRELRSVSWRIP